MPTTDGVEAGHVVGPVAVRAELLRAHGRVVARIEEEHDALALVVGELEGAGGARKLEVWGRLADLWSLGHS